MAGKPTSSPAMMFFWKEELSEKTKDGGDVYLKHE